MNDMELAEEIERYLNTEAGTVRGRGYLHSGARGLLERAIAALRRGPDLKAAYFEGYEDAMKDRNESERPPSGEMILAQCRLILDSRNDNIVLQGYLNSLEDLVAAAEAEGRKS